MNSSYLSQQFANALQGVTDVKDVMPAVRTVLARAGKQSDARIAYVAGILTSDGQDRFEANAALLRERTVVISRDRPLAFCILCIWTDELLRATGADQSPASFWHEWCSDLLGLGLIDEVVLTPRWQDSAGALVEHEVATRLQIPISVADDEVAAPR